MVLDVIFGVPGITKDFELSPLHDNLWTLDELLPPQEVIKKARSTAEM